MDNKTVYVIIFDKDNYYKIDNESEIVMEFKTRKEAEKYIAENLDLREFDYRVKKIIKKVI